MIDVRDTVMMVEGLAEGMHVILISYTVYRCVEGRPDYSALIIITLYNFNDHIGGTLLLCDPVIQYCYKTWRYYTCGGVGSL